MLFTSLPHPSDTARRLVPLLEMETLETGGVPKVIWWGHGRTTVRSPGQGTSVKCEMLLLFLILMLVSLPPSLSSVEASPTDPKASNAVRLPRSLHLHAFDTGRTFIPKGDLGLRGSIGKSVAFRGSQLRLLCWWYRGIGLISEGHSHTAVSPVASGQLLLVYLFSGLSLPMVLEDSMFLLCPLPN